MDREADETRLSDDEKRNAEAFHCVYLYYLKYRSDGSLESEKIYEWFDPDIGDPIKNPVNVIKRLALNAIENGNRPPFYTDDHQYMMMRRRSYVAIVFDADGIDIGDINNYKFKGMRKDNNNYDIEIDSRYVFKNFKHFKFETGLSDPSEVIIVYFENHMKSYNGAGQCKLAKSEWEDFYFKLPTTKRGRPIEDSGGTNMGPPVPPPSRR